MAAFAPGDPWDRRRNRVVYVHLEWQRARLACSRYKEIVHQLPLERLGPQQDLMRIRRKAQLTPLAERPLRELLVTLPAHRLVQRMAREIGLNQHIAAKLAAARTPRNLGEQ